MRITMLAFGSRGDVQPFVALAVALRAVGHDVRIVAADDYRDLVCSYGVPFAGAGSIRDLMNPAAVYDALDGARNPLRLARTFLDELSPLIGQIMQASCQAAHDADLLLASTLGAFIAANLAEALQVPYLVCHLHPYGPTASSASVFFPNVPSGIPLRGAYNRLSHYLTDRGYWLLLRGALNRARASVLRLSPRSARNVAHTGDSYRRGALFGYSPIVAPRPSDWPAGHVVTGYWTLGPPTGWTPPADLVAFVEAGPPPIFIGFGSMLVGRDPRAFTRMIVDAIASAGCRAIIQTGWGDWGNETLPPSIFRAPSVPHAWLFERVAAVVTHGGAGTTAAALRAGVGIVVVPFLGDQHFWAERVHHLGLAPPPLPRTHLTAARLAASIDAACASQSRAAARSMALRLQAEDGPARAVSALNNLAGQTITPP